ncbi:DUF2639 domain-containing protein [Lysinibacillus sp. UGB7]
MAHVGTKGFYIKKLKEAGITHHPETQKSLKLYKTHELASLLTATK